MRRFFGAVGTSAWALILLPMALYNACIAVTRNAEAQAHAADFAILTAQANAAIALYNVGTSTDREAAREVLSRISKALRVGTFAQAIRGAETSTPTKPVALSTIPGIIRP